MRRIVVSLWLLAAAPAATAQDRIEIRAHWLLPTAVQAALHRVAAERELELPANTDPTRWLRGLCGGAITDEYERQYKELNGARSLEPVTASQLRKVPACPPIRGRLSVEIQTGEYELAHPLRRVLGVRPDHELTICEPHDQRCRQVTAEAWLREALRLPAPRPVALTPGQRIDLPFRSTPQTIVLRSEISAQEAVRILNEAMGGREPRRRPMTVREAPRLGLIRPLESGDEDLGSSCDPALGVPEDWPFNRKEVRSAILDGLAMLGERERQGKGRLERTVIRIADTGIDRPEEVFGPNARFLARNPRERPGAISSEDGNEFIGDVFGISPGLRGDLTPVGTAIWRREHGAQVATYALGGPGFREDFDLLGNLLGLNFARLFEALGSVVVVQPDMLAASFRVKPPEVHIVNMSVGGWNAITSLSDRLDLHDSRKQLAVMAAGNDGRTLDVTDTAGRFYPVFYRGDPQYASRLLVVGAHAPPVVRDVAGERVWHAAGADFSNRGKELVDLLAPGCRLPDPFPQTGSSVLSGTSLAAPLASFTAAILRAFLPQPAEPPQIRLRLATTIRWLDDPVAHETAFGGALDIAAALRVFDDVVRRRDGELIVGRWITPDTVRFCRSTDLEEEGDPLRERRTDEVARVRVQPQPGEQPRLFVYLRTSFNELKLVDEGCEAASESLTFLVDGVEQRIPWREIAAFVPAASPNERRPHGGPPRPAVVSVAPPPHAEVARALSELGFVPATPPGRPPTATIREFQIRRGELPTGTLTGPQLNALRRAVR